jgi:uncharacterized protein GlcG (DUF336 family)
MTITPNAAEAMIERARAHATSIDVPMNIAVTDGGGRRWLRGSAVRE